MKKLNRIIGKYILDRYKENKQRSADISLEHCMQVARSTANKTKYGFLISQGAKGWSSARLVEPIVEDDFSTIWIGTHPNLRKIREIWGDPRVTLAFGNLNERANLVIFGEAHIEADITLRRKYWKAEWRLFFPNGPSGDDYVLIKISPWKMELMSFQRNVIIEPFGLRPVVLIYQNNEWSLKKPGPNNSAGESRTASVFPKS